MKHFISRIPVPIAGLMLALAATGNLLVTYGNVYKVIFGTISALILLLIIIKIFIDNKSIIADLNNPAIASVAPTFSMGIMILSTYLKAAVPNAAYIMWIAGFIIHCALILYFTKKHVLGFDIKKVFPSYFVVYVGIVTASVTGPVFHATGLGMGVFWFGLIAYLILIPVIAYRAFAVKSIPEPILPTMTIFAAPASLCLTGYLNSFQQKNMFIVYFLTALSLAMLIATLLYMPKMLRLKFYPSYSAFTFPMVISAIAIKGVNGFLAAVDHGIPYLIYIVKIEELLAVGLVVYVLIRYMFFLFGDRAVNRPAVSSISK